MFGSTWSRPRRRNEPVSNNASGSVGIRRNQSGLFLHLKGGAPQAPRSGQDNRLDRACKRIFDVIFAAVSLFMLAPVLLATALAVKFTSAGPVFYSQLRDGEAGKPFRSYKFRSLFSDKCDESGLEQVVPDDERITPVGRFLRSSNIDELPQLYNILVGDMSFIGPRPHPVGMLAAGRKYDELVPYYHLRHEVKPGLSGWAQINGLRGPTSDPQIARARINHDIAYVQNFSLWLDFRILGMTLWREFLRRQTSHRH